MDAQEFRANGQAVIELIAQYLETIEERPVTADVKPGDVRHQLPAHPQLRPNLSNLCSPMSVTSLFLDSPTGSTQTSLLFFLATRPIRQYLLIS